MKKRIYRKTPVKDVQANALVSQLPGPIVVVAVDVAKHDMVAAFATQQAGVVTTVAWTHPRESRALLRLLAALQAAGKTLHAVMEPSGTYGDALRLQLAHSGVAVFRVGTKRTHGAAEIYDSVPSMHDANAASILARLHLQGLSSPWKDAQEHTRELKAALTIMELHQG